MKINKLSAFPATAGLGMVFSNDANAFSSLADRITAEDNSIRFQLSENDSNDSDVETVATNNRLKLALFFGNGGGCHPVASC